MLEKFISQKTFYDDNMVSVENNKISTIVFSISFSSCTICTISISFSAKSYIFFFSSSFVVIVNLLICVYGKMVARRGQMLLVVQDLDLLGHLPDLVHSG